MPGKPKSTESQKLLWLKENKKKIKDLTDREVYFLMISAGLYSPSYGYRDAVYVLRRLLESI